MICAELFHQARRRLGGVPHQRSFRSGEEGNDIICAAVSSAAYMTANTVTEIIGVEAQVAAEEGYMLVRIPAKAARDCRVLFAGFKLHMLGLEEQYSENINVSYVEV